MNTRLLSLLLCLLLAGCASGPAPTPPATTTPTAVPTIPTPTPDPRQGGRLIVRLSRDLEQLTPLQMADDPEAAWVMSVLYVGLTRLDDRLMPRPGLAESWAVSDDGLEITFTLRPGLRWSDGVPLTSADVRFTWDLLDMWEPRLGVQADLRDYVAGITLPTTRTVVVVLNRRLAGILTDASFPILPQHVWGGRAPRAVLTADLLQSPVGSGPFLLQERRPGEALVLAPNPHYYGPAPFFDEVAFLVAPDPQVTELALRQGDLDVAFLSPSLYRALQDDPPGRPLRLARYAAPQFTFIGLNVRPESPLADPAVRQAWALAVDKEALVAAATSGEGLPLWSPILPMSWAYADDLPHPGPDLPRARDLLAAAGWQDGNGDGVVEKDGRPLQVRLFVRADAPERVAACQDLAGQLARVGISVQVIPADLSVIEAKLRPPYDFDALGMQWRHLGPDPDLFYLFHSSQVWQGAEDKRENLYNFVGYRSDQADRLILAGRDTYDLQARRDACERLQQLLAQDLPYYLLWGDPVYLAADAHLTTDEGPVDLETPNLFWNIERWYFQR